MHIPHLFADNQSSAIANNLFMALSIPANTTNVQTSEYGAERREQRYSDTVRMTH